MRSNLSLTGTRDWCSLQIILKVKTAYRDKNRLGKILGNSQPNLNHDPKHRRND